MDAIKLSSEASCGILFVIFGQPIFIEAIFNTIC